MPETLVPEVGMFSDDVGKGWILVLRQVVETIMLLALANHLPRSSVLHNTKIGKEGYCAI